MTEQPHDQDTTPNEDPTTALAAWAGRVAGAAALEAIAKQVITAAVLEGDTEATDLTAVAGRAATVHAVEQLQHLQELISLGAIPGKTGDSVADAINDILDSPAFDPDQAGY